MRVAVVGSGVAGLTAAYLLSRRHEVVLLEKDDRLGGHARTVDVADGQGGTVAIDTGFIVHNRRTYPNLTRLFDELGVETRPSDMSMSVRCDGCGLEYAGSRGLPGAVPTAGTLLRGAYLRTLLEVKRFHLHGRAVLADPSTEPLSLGAMMREGGYSEHFSQHFLRPLVSAVWSTPHDITDDYPARYLMRFLDNHGMLSVSGSPTWRTVVGGSRTYVERAARSIGTVRTGAEVVGVLRDDAGATVKLAPDEELRVDALVVATHPDQALKLLDDATEDERRVLGAWRYSRNEAALHSDSSVLPRVPRARASWNTVMGRCGDDGGQVRVTYDLTRLMGLGTEDGGPRYLVGLNDAGRIDPVTVHDRTFFEHPVYDREALDAQRDLPRLNGVRNTWFCGAYHGWGFHEDGCASGVRVARGLGVDW